MMGLPAGGPGSDQSAHTSAHAGVVPFYGGGGGGSGHLNAAAAAAAVAAARGYPQQHAQPEAPHTQQRQLAGAAAAGPPKSVRCICSRPGEYGQMVKCQVQRDWGSGGGAVLQGGVRLGHEGCGEQEARGTGFTGRLSSAWPAQGA